MAGFPKAFPAFEIHCIEVGERSGSLPESLAYLAGLLQRRRLLSRKMRAALLYPGIIAIGTVGVTGFLLLYTLPKIVPIFQDLNVTLPFTTRVLIRISDSVSDHGVLMSGMSCLLAFCLFWFARTPWASRSIELMVLRTPLIGRLVSSYNLALISKTLSTLLSSGISLIPALALVGNGMTHSLYREAVSRLGERVNEGSRLSTELGRFPKLFPHTFMELTFVGESTGSLGKSLGTAADLYEEELDEQTRTLTTLIEPALMIVMGLMVGFVAMAIITPIYGITQGMPAR